MKKNYVLKLSKQKIKRFRNQFESSIVLLHIRDLWSKSVEWCLQDAQIALLHFMRLFTPSHLHPSTASSSSFSMQGMWKYPSVSISSSSFWKSLIRTDNRLLLWKLEILTPAPTEQPTGHWVWSIQIISSANIKNIFWMYHIVCWTLYYHSLTFSWKCWHGPLEGECMIARRQSARRGKERICSLETSCAYNSTGARHQPSASLQPSSQPGQSAPAMG